jgi:hypothetical protein
LAHGELKQITRSQDALVLIAARRKITAIGAAIGPFHYRHRRRRPDIGRCWIAEGLVIVFKELLIGLEALSSRVGVVSVAYGLVV